MLSCLYRKNILLIMEEGNPCFWKAHRIGTRGCETFKQLQNMVIAKHTSAAKGGMGSGERDFSCQDLMWQ